MTEVVLEKRVLNSVKPYTNEPIGKQGECILTWMKPNNWGVWILIDVKENKK